MEEPSMTGDGKKTLIVAGAALELLIEFSNNTVTGVTLGFPESAEIVNKHAVEAGKILLKDLQIEHNQSPLTKSLEPFARNFERLALLDKLSINPGLNLYEAVAGIYESLQRLHNWELHKSREDPSLTGKSDLELALIALCTKSGRPSMNGRGRVGLSLDFWTEKRLQPYPTPEAAAHAAETNKTWSLLIGCAPLREMGANPVRITDKWISLDVASGPTIDWLEPEPTFVPAESQTQTGPLQPGSPMMPGPRLPEAVFQATFDPPLHISLDLWNRIIDFGCGLDSSHHKFVMYDSLVIPAPTSKANEQTDTRTVICTKKVQAAPVGQPAELTHKTHTNTLYVYDAVPGKTLTELTFSHPSQLVQLLPYLRQYAFLSILLENSFKDDSVTVSTTPASAANKGATSSVKSDTNQDDFRSFMRGSGQQNSKTQNDAVPKQEGKEESLKVDVTLTVLPVPRLQVVFPFRDKTANILVEIRENGHVHVEAQNVLDESNMNATQNGRQRRVEDIGGLLMYMEDIGKWAEFIRTRWA
ncbi:mediator of RNA polymerase II transcription subunit 1-domain-containing protein [Podospora australis]|uniref:Mediator of RNA polymerase II transcription subunit 1 n=1 Tax=Podospora australis TaxID=1536484 RepID=A0AAN6X1C6_9PEZI|nr:mediator of RNA polymerase II transcription subunit 1-domain-containing protein [Podospora australis]